MKITFSDNKYIVFLKDIFRKDIDKLCEDIINLLNDKFYLELKGFFDIEIFIDDRYGTILEIKNEYDNIYSNFSKYEFNINVIDTKFIYRIIDFSFFDINKLYFYQDNFYIMLEDVNNDNIEFCQLMYRNSEQIINNSKLTI